MPRTSTATERCPVCDYPIDQKARTIRLGGKRVRVCCDECADKARAKAARLASGR